MRRWKGWQAWVLTVVVLSVVCAVGWVWWRGRATRTAEGSVAYRVVAVRRGPIEVAVRATGTVQAVERRELRAGVGGKVARVQFARGERVKAGQVLIELSDENQRAKLEKAGLSLEQEQRNLDQLLQKQDALVVKAPVRGRVADVPVAEGQRVGEDTPVASIVDDTHLEVRAQFTKAQVDKISIGQAAHVFLPDYFSTVSGQVTAVNRLGQAGGAGAVLYPVTIQVENPGGLEVGAVAVAYVESSSGELAAVQTSPLAEPGPRVVRAQVGGTVARLSVRKGDGVEAGQVLVTLAPGDLEQQIEAQRLRVRQAELDRASGADDLASLTIVTPIDGVVADVSVAEGDEVGSNAVVAVVANYDRLKIVAPVDELDISKVRVGQEVLVTTEALPGKTFRGEVTEVAQEGRTQGGVGVFDVTVKVSDPGDLRAGMTADVRVQVASKQDVLLVPVEAVTRRGNQYVVWVMGATGGAGGDSASRRSGQFGAPEVSGGLPPGAHPVTVEVGLVSSTAAEITAGLREGEQVLVLYGADGNSQGGYSTRPGTRMGVPGLGFPREPGQGERLPRQ